MLYHNTNGIVKPIDTNNEGITIPNLGALILDMQEHHLKFVDEPERSALISANLEMINFLRSHEIPTIVLEFGRPGTTIKQIKGALKGLSNVEYITRYNSNGFSDQTLNDQLKIWEIYGFLLAGIFASHCIKTTGKNAIDKGYTIHTAKPLIANQRYQQKQFLRDVPTWFAHNGVYSNDIDGLCNKIVHNGK